jgi:type I restriction enzyme S subunit
MTGRRTSFGDAVVINPKLQLARGVEAPHIEMADLEEGNLAVGPGRRRSYSGGSRFQNGDVLFARITPCLENGKTAEVSGLGSGEVGHGSTEFLVFRARTGLVDPVFLRYLSVEPRFRAYAVANMNGSSGRQRVSADAISRYMLDLPPLDEQRAIGEVLATLDAKIDGNGQAIRACDALVTQAYVDALGDRATEINLGSAVSVVKGVSYRSEDLRSGGGGLFSLKCFARDGSLAEDGLKPYDGPFKDAQRLAPGDIVVAQTDLTQDASVVGRALRVPDGLDVEPIVASLDVSVVRPHDERLPPSFLAAALRADAFRQYCRARSNGTTVLHMRSGTIESFDLPIPSPGAVARLEEMASVLFALTDGLRRERRELGVLRDALLAALLAGERTVRAGT